MYSCRDRRGPTACVSRGPVGGQRYPLAAWIKLIIQKTLWRRKIPLAGDRAREESTATAPVPGAKQMGSPILAHERRVSQPAALRSP